jgi:hypothetical protein
MIGKIFKYIWENGVLPFLKSLGPSLEWMGRRFMDFLKIVKFVAEVIGKMIRTGVMIAVAAFMVLANVISRVIPPVLELIGKIIGRVINILQGLIKFVVGVFTGNWKMAWDGIKLIVTNIFGLIKDVFVGAVKVIKGIFVGFVKGIVDAAKWLWNKLVGHSIFPDIVKGIIYWFTYLWKQGPKIFGYLISGIIALSQKLLQLIIGVTKSMVAPFIKAGTWLYQYGKNFVQGLWNGIKAIWDDLQAWVKGAIEWLKGRKGIFGSAGTWLLQAGKNVIAGFKNGMVAIWKDVTTWVAGIAQWIRDHKGPISLDGKLLVPAGMAIMRGFLNGLKKGAGPAWDFVTKVGGKSVAALQALLGPATANLPADVAAGVLGGPNRRVFYQGEAFDLSTYQKLLNAMKRVGAINVTQGGYEARSSYSGSTHMGGGVFDVVGGNLTSILAALKSSGLIGWIRNPNQGNWPWHIHALDPSDIGRMSASARAQVADYYRGGNGLAGYRQGTPWVPDDGLAFLHRGEAVLSAEMNAARLAAKNKPTVGPIIVNTQEIDPRKHAADLGWEISRRVS